MDDDTKQDASLDELIVGQATEAIVNSGARGTIRRRNGAAVRLSGHAAQEAPGQLPGLIIPGRRRGLRFGRRGARRQCTRATQKATAAGARLRNRQET